MTESGQEQSATREVKPFIFQLSGPQMKGVVEKYAALAWYVRFDDYFGDFNTRAFPRLHQSSDWEAM